jgi:hypothetical protein
MCHMEFLPESSPLSIDYGQLDLGNFGEGIEWASATWIWVWRSVGVPTPSLTTGLLQRLTLVGSSYYLSFKKNMWLTLVPQYTSLYTFYPNLNATTS